MQPTTVTGLLHILSREGTVMISLCYYPNYLKRSDVENTCVRSSFIQADADCSKAINLDKKVTSFLFFFFFGQLICLYETSSIHVLNIM